MATYGIAATKEGNEALASYAENGESEQVSFLAMCILSRAQGFTKTVDIIRFLNVEYPTAIADGAINNAIHKLELAGYLKVTREVTLDNKVQVCMGNYVIPTILGDFLNASLKNGNAIKITDICDDLKWHGESRRLADVTLRLV